MLTASIARPSAQISDAPKIVGETMVCMLNTSAVIHTFHIAAGRSGTGKSARTSCLGGGKDDKNVHRLLKSSSSALFQGIAKAHSFRNSSRLPVAMHLLSILLP